MLKLFEVEGFKNFDKKLTIDFSDVHDYKFNTNCVKNGMLSKTIVYGKNSIGKSNLGLAIFDIVSHLTEKNVTPVLYDYYLNSDSATKYAEFRYVFDFDGKEIDYHYCKNGKRNLMSEKIFLDGTLLFEYDYNKKTGSFEYLKELSPTLNLDFRDIESVLKYAVNNTVLSENHLLKKMIKFVSSMLWFRNLDENRYIGYKTKSSDYIDFIFEDGILDEFQDFLHQSGVNENLIIRTDADGINRLYFDKKTPLPFLQTASNGTKALYTFFYWYKTASEVSFMFIDEFDAFYHFELAENIVSLLEKMPDSQVMLTSHNTNLLSNRIMRPDCYFILTKNNITSLVNATDRELREGHNLEKLYMSGEFNG